MYGETVSERPPQTHQQFAHCMGEGRAFEAGEGGPNLHLRLYRLRLYRRRTPYMARATLATGAAPAFRIVHVTFWLV